MENRVEVQKTYKIFIGGAFPRTESGRYYKFENADRSVLANLCLSSRKDFRNAVVSARNAFGGWSEKSAFNRSQILYRIAEMLESKKEQLIAERIKEGTKKAAAEKEILQGIDTFIYYAGWADKFQQIYSAVNPVSSSHFNFSVYEPTGVVTLILDGKTTFNDFAALISAIICGGNSSIVVSENQLPLSLMSFAEIIQNSDVSGGVINILTGKIDELLKDIAPHMDVNHICYQGDDVNRIKLLKENAAFNVKRIKISENSVELNPYHILDFMEVKTTWHPIETIGSAASSY